MGIWIPVPWRRVDRKQMLYPLDHNAPLWQMNFNLFIIQMVFYSEAGSYDTGASE